MNAPNKSFKEKYLNRKVAIKWGRATLRMWVVEYGVPLDPDFDYLGIDPHEAGLGIAEPSEQPEEINDPYRSIGENGSWLKLSDKKNGIGIYADWDKHEFLQRIIEPKKPHAPSTKGLVVDINGNVTEAVIKREDPSEETGKLENSLSISEDYKTIEYNSRTLHFERKRHLWQITMFLIWRKTQPGYENGEFKFEKIIEIMKKDYKITPPSGTFRELIKRLPKNIRETFFKTIDQSREKYKLLPPAPKCQIDIEKVLNDHFA